MKHPRVEGRNEANCLTISQQHEALDAANATFQDRAPMSHMAFILLKEHEQAKASVIVEALKKRHPEQASLITEAPSEPGARPNDSFFLFAGQIVAILSIGAPLPYDADVVKRVTRTWADAPRAFESHRAHLAISIPGQQRNSLKVARVVTAVAGAVLETVQGGLGVLWNTSIAHPPSVWKEKSQHSFAPYPNFPMSLWLSMNPFQYESGVGVLTFGLAPFIGREVEFQGNGLDLSIAMNRVGGFSAYLLERGEAVKDGDTFGISDVERIHVHEASSDRFNGMPVFLATPLQGGARAAQ